MKNYLLLISLVWVSIQTSFGQINQNRKKIKAVRSVSKIAIDGIIDDEGWNHTEAAKDFVMMRPDNGKPEPETHKTIVKVLYDNDAIYIAATMHAPDPKKIPVEFTNRDGIGNNDFFLVTINPNDDGQNPFEFIVTSSGAQADAKISNGNEDFNWSAVWESAMRMNNDSWTVEMKIPYRALRFANVPVQSWGFNFHRRVQNLNAQFTWNHIDNRTGMWTQYDGLIEDFRDIVPPTRLAFYPYASAQVKHGDGETDFDWSAGMDVKYGISENFTLDATLIPDFSQVGFDDVRLNLGPFEQQFTEQRQFFTEGTELFNLGNLFYSRRIGGSPIDQFSNERRDDDDFSNGIKINDEVVNSPDKVNMLNAVKISGRTKNGWGLGFFNAVTEKTEARVKRTTQTQVGTDIEEETSYYNQVINPLSNYNIIAVDKQFNGNSSIQFVNTNVWRNGEFRDANTTGLDWHIEDKSSNYNIDGSFQMSNISDDPDAPSTGYTFDTSIGKHSGKWRWEVGYNFEDENFDPNDFGILFSNNEQNIYGSFRYRQLKPSKKLNNSWVNVFFQNSFLKKPGTYTGSFVGLNWGGNTKKRFNFGGNFNFNNPRKDFFEPRQGSMSGIYLKRPTRLNVNHWGNTDDRKKLSLSYFTYYTYFDFDGQNSYGFDISPRYRFNSQFSVRYSFEYDKNNNNQGYVDEDNGSIYIGQRDWTSVENSVSSKYSFSTNSSLSLTFRHNWSKVPYNKFYELNQNNGSLMNTSYTGEHDVNFNSWNLDLNYIWQFAPGSQLIAFYRHSIFDEDSNANRNFGQNVKHLFKQPNFHTFSIRLVYFIDYNSIKNVF